MSALTDAIARSFATREPERPALSPMRALGRRRLSGIEVLAQSVATTAPAVSMVVLPVTMLTHDRLLGGMVTILVATIAVTLIAFCVSQFTRRMAAAGGLHSFAFRGSGTRAALTVAVAMLVKYVGSAVMTLYHGGQAVIALCGLAGFSPPVLPVYLALGVGILSCLLRSVRFAALTILTIEVSSLVFIVGLMAFGDSASQTALVPPSSGHGTLALALAALFALAGFESAVFFGPEAQRPLVTVTRTVLFTPMICGSLFVFAGWAAWSGRSDTLVNAYLHGTSTGVSPAVVVALNVGLCCSWLASAMASSNAASRLVYSLGIERALPRWCARVHRSFRTPFAALTAVVGLVVLGAGAFAILGTGVVFGDLRLVVRGAVIVAYVIVAIASVRFLTRIGEQTPGVRAASTLGSVAGVTVLGYLLYVNVIDVSYVVPIAVAAVLSSGLLWRARLRRRRPDALLRMGAFDSAESADVLPGAGVFGADATGQTILVGRGPR
ncbi:amino acid/polyamine/organocation transporter (APC superfamily) [Rhodococcus sp. OK519]|uniref:APC family permease n=1 Tax=Rhodococcus sp. OK519 TaxID=2135729 RepID=UPI000D37B4B7|nr:amino acid/polyamine/organocation transporter (APC superfamily) [Rhodococcus sp. OK519]